MRALVLVGALAACSADPPPRREAPIAVAPPDPFELARERMVRETLIARGIADPRVIDAMRLVPRHELVPPELRDHAYDDRPLPIGFGLTISQPYIVAVMTEAARVRPGARVLEIGTGSGYQAAVLHAMGADVYTIEIHEELARRTGELLGLLGFDEIHRKAGDGYFGWPDAAPFDAILVTAAAPIVPYPLAEQLKVGGRMVIPIGDDPQQLKVITREPDAPDLNLDHQTLFEVRFGPMIGAIDETP